MISISGGLPSPTQFSGSVAPMLPEDHSLIGWSCPLDYARDVSALTVEVGAGNLRLSAIRRVPAATITNLHVCVTGAGATLTSGQCLAALYTRAGALLGVTATQHTAWQSTGIKTMALTAPVAVPAGDYYVGFWYNGTTAPNFSRSGLGGVTAQATFGQVSGNYSAANADSGLTTTAPATLGTQAQSLLHWWVAVS